MAKKSIFRKILLILSYTLGGLVLLLVAAGLYAYGYTEWQYNRHYTYYTPRQELPTDSASLARGKHLYAVHSCKQCHGEDLGGTLMADNLLLGKVGTRNLTNGQGGVGHYRPEDWMRVLKHGVNPKGKPLVIMPSHETALIPDDDLRAIIAYCRQQPPVDKQLPFTLGPMLRMLVAFGQLGPMPVDKIDHNRSPIARPQEAVSPEFGSTLAITCSGCHKADFRGGPSEVPGFPPVPDISPTGRPGRWSEAQFVQTLRTGVTPEGHTLDDEHMPWKRFKDFSNTELAALRAYLYNLPVKPPAMADK